MTHLVAWLWQGAVIAGVTTLAVRMIPGASASKRHVILWIALALTLLLPWVQPLMFFAGAQLQTAADVPVQPIGLALPPPPAWLGPGAILLWAVLAIFSFSRLILGLWTLRRLLRSSVPLAAEHAERFTRWRAARPSRRVEIRVSSGIVGACAVGFGRPAILISSSLAATLNDDDLESIVLHEQAHLQRYDDWSRAAQCIVLGLARWHPAVLWISRKIDVEREISCDQWAIARACSPLAYARSLARAAELIAGTRGRTPLLAPGASTSSSLLRLRIERLLEPAAVGRSYRASWISAAVGTAVATTAIGLSNVPQVITFTASAARSATLASKSFLTGVPIELPAMFISRAPVAIPTGDDAAAAPQTLIVIPESSAERIVERRERATTANSSAVVHETASVSIHGVAKEHLGSTSIPFLARVPVTEPAVVPVTQPAATREADGVDWSVLGRTSIVAGLAVGKAGTATGLAASRAGTSVGRFFKSGGLALAKSF
jgi:hypothetical protein